MMELLITVAVLGTVAGIGLVSASNVKGSAQRTKLEANVASLNRAVSAYLANGGKIPTTSSAVQVITGLKKVAGNGSRLAGYEGSFVDSRLMAVSSTQSASSTHPLVVWDANSMKFVLSTNASTGIEEFRFDSVESARQSETREQRVKLSAQSNWVWDFADAGVAGQQPSMIGVSEVAEDAHPADPNSSGSLLPPAFSILGGTLPSDQFPLALVLTNPNPTGGTIKYALDGGAWMDYSEPLPIVPGQEISAFVSAQGAQSSHDSYIRSELYLTDSSGMDFSGSASGEFTNAEGGTEMVATLDGNRFEWGNPVFEDGFDKGSWLKFDGASFSHITADEMFLLGNLEFFNATINMGTGATHVSLDVDLSLAEPNFSQTFTFGFDILDTKNLAEQSADENADYVWLLNPEQNLTTTFGGNQYKLNVTFGFLGEEGFSTVDTFHVHEGSHATASLMGQFVLVNE